MEHTAVEAVHAVEQAEAEPEEAGETDLPTVEAASEAASPGEEIAPPELLAPDEPEAAQETTDGESPEQEVSTAV
jgi:hypothetical protein